MILGPPAMWLAAIWPWLQTGLFSAVSSVVWYSAYRASSNRRSSRMRFAPLGTNKRVACSDPRTKPGVSTKVTICVAGDSIEPDGEGEGPGELGDVTTVCKARSLDRSNHRPPTANM